jgi:tRNA pseudouridine55 synthase
MDGLIVVDKPAGPTSHDIVQRLRRLLKERSIGHTGTLDPMATGVLALVLGKATRLARFLSNSDKCYDAVVTLGQSTDTYDADGEPIGERHRGALPTRAAIETALTAFRGTFLQQPPAYSAKKIGGERSYKLARESSDLRPLPSPARVTVHALDLVSVEGESVALMIHCSAGFYVRSLAHDLGACLGVGGHLSALRRTRVGPFTLATAMNLDEAEQDADEVASFIVPMAQLLPGLPAVVLNAEGVLRASHGRDLRPVDLEPGTPAGSEAYWRLLDRDGGLVGIAEPGNSPGLLHPSIVLM